MRASPLHRLPGRAPSPRRSPRRPLGARALPALAATLAMLAIAGARADAAFDLVYAQASGADAIHDGGLTAAVRQAPIFDEPRWPARRQVAKLSGAELAALSDAQIVRRLRLAFARPERNGMVSVDEILPAQWSAEGAEGLSRAMTILGPDAGRVIFYASASLVAQVGRHDLRLELAERNRALVAAMSRGRVFIEGYRSDMSPLPPHDMATYLSRWWERVPAEARHRLHVLIGPGDQRAIWDSVRSTPAGRAILRNGVGAYRQDTPEAGRAWVAAYRAFLADPEASPPGGDAHVPVGGGLSMAVDEGQELRGGDTLRIAIARPGSANLRVQALPNGPERVFAKLRPAPVGDDVPVRLPDDLRPGRYRLTVYLSGDGLVDRVTRTVLVVPDRAAPPQGPIALRRQLIVNQRISQTAVRRLNAVQEWLDAGITTDDLAPAIGGEQFGTSVMLGSRPPAPVAPASPRPITPSPPPPGGSAVVRVTPAQLLINQRISQAAVRRANALEERLREGLTGGDIQEGAVTKEKLHPGLRVVGTIPTERPPASSTVIAPPEGKGLPVRLTRAQLVINQRISQAAVRRANGLIARLEEGVSAELIRPRSLTSANLAPSLR